MHNFDGAKIENTMRRSYIDQTQFQKPTPSLCRETYLFVIIVDAHEVRHVQKTLE